MQKLTDVKNAKHRTKNKKWLTGLYDIDAEWVNYQIFDFFPLDFITRECKSLYFTASVRRSIAGLGVPEKGPTCCIFLCWYLLQVVGWGLSGFGVDFRLYMLMAVVCLRLSCGNCQVLAICCWMLLVCWVSGVGCQVLIVDCLCLFLLNFPLAVTTSVHTYPYIPSSSDIRYVTGAKETFTWGTNWVKILFWRLAFFYSRKKHLKNCSHQPQKWMSQR